MIKKIEKKIILRGLARKKHTFLCKFCIKYGVFHENELLTIKILTHSSLVNCYLANYIRIIKNFIIIKNSMLFKKC